MAKSKSTTRSRGLSPIVLDRMLNDLHHRLAIVASNGKDMALAASTIQRGTGGEFRGAVSPVLTLVQITALHQADDLRGLADLVALIIKRTQTPAVIKARQS